MKKRSLTWSLKPKKCSLDFLNFTSRAHKTKQVNQNNIVQGIALFKVLLRTNYQIKPPPADPSCFTLSNVVFTKYSKHWPFTVAHTIDCVCSKMLNHGLNHGFFLSLFKLISCPIHWIVCVLAYLNFIFEF